jgi:hypothetical protein
MKKLPAPLQPFYHGKNVAYGCKLPDEVYIDFGRRHYYSIEALDAAK